MGVLVVSLFFLGCKAEKVPCKNVVQGDYILVP